MKPIIISGLTEAIAFNNKGSKISMFKKPIFLRDFKEMYWPFPQTGQISLPLKVSLKVFFIVCFHVQLVWQWVHVGISINSCYYLYDSQRNWFRFPAKFFVKHRLNPTNYYCHACK
nr:hypothetical protein [Planococcus chinensis]